MSTAGRRTVAQHDLGSMRVRYITEDGVVGLEIVPIERDDLRVSPRTHIDDEPSVAAVVPEGVAARAIDPLALLHVRGDAIAGGFAGGRTMRTSRSAPNEWIDQSATDRTVTTSLRTPHGLDVTHRLRLADGDAALWIDTTVRNDTDRAWTLDALSSFCLTALSPFDRADSRDRMVVHRYRSGWSAEVRRESRTLEELHMERSWIGASVLAERFGQVGTMPVRQWVPFVAVEDTAAEVVWAAEIAWSGSWQLEVSRRQDDISLSGGLADRELGHWSITLQPGESIASPAALVTAVAGDLDDAQDALLLAQNAGTEPELAGAVLPVVANEWCTSWGEPTHDNLASLADALQDEDVAYLVIDAGWYKRPDAGWWNGHGDWIPNASQFPDGIGSAAAAIRSRGLIPGLWFEWETVGEESSAFSIVDHLAARDGVPITVGTRRFWDMSDPWVIDHLAERVIDLLEEGGFGYVKIDYNETIGLGIDHPDGLGEGLRRQVLGSYALFDLLRARLPHVIIENCASGGHRMDPAMVARTDVTSITDAHETRDLPIIAAQTQCLVPARKAQVWAVVRTDDDAARMVYTLAATFLGRVCLSGDLPDLSPAQWTLLRRVLEVYRRAAPVIVSGRSRRFGELSTSWRPPRGWQGVRRVHADEALIVVHWFADPPADVTVPLPEGSWEIVETVGSEGGDIGDVTVSTSGIRLTTPGPLRASVIRARRVNR